MSPPEARPEKLPLWRLAAALLILGGFIVVLIGLAPAYIENYRLQGYIRELTRGPGASNVSDETLRTRVIDRARGLHLLVEPGDVQVTRPPGRVRIETKYAIHVDFRLYQVDLHFH